MKKNKFPTIKQLVEAIKASTNSPEVTYIQETREFKVLEAVPYLSEDRCSQEFELCEFTITFYQAYNTWLDMQWVESLSLPCAVHCDNTGIEPVELPF